MGLFVLSGAVYVGGALGFELLGGWYASSEGVGNIQYAIITTFEELFEMLGIVFFIYSLLTYIKSEFDSYSITVKSGGRRRARFMRSNLKTMLPG